MVTYGCESWTVKTEQQRIDAFKLWCWRLLRDSWTARRSNQSILREISPEYSLEGLMLKLKLQYFGTQCEELTDWKDPDAQKDWKQEEKGTAKYEVGWHHCFDGHEFEQAPGVGGVLWNLACYSLLDHKESGMTEWLHWIEYILECTKLRHWYLLQML